MDAFWTPSGRIVDTFWMPFGSRDVPGVHFGEYIYFCCFWDVTPSQAPNQSENENRVGETTAQRVLPQVITARRVAPIYPATSRRRSEEGDVVLDVLVGADGRVTQITVAGSSDFERLDKAAVAAVQQWRFVPGRVAGEPQAMRLRVPIRFQLR